MSKVRIQSGDGHQLFDFSAPDWTMFNNMNVSASLGRQMRFNGNLVDPPHAPKCSTYSVAQHVVLAAELAYRMGYGIQTIYAVLHHDDTEMVTGDIVSPLKQHIPELGVFCKAIELKYSDHIGTTAEHKLVKKIDDLMYYHEAIEIFGDESAITDVELTTLLQYSHYMSTIVPWSPRIATMAYRAAAEIIGKAKRGPVCDTKLVLRSLPALIIGMNAGQITEETK